MDRNFDGIMMESQERQEILYTAFAEARDAAAILDSDARVIYWNHAAETLFGYAGEEILGAELSVLVEESEYEILKESFLVFRLSSSEGEKGKTIELEVKNRYGQKFYVEFSLTAFQHDNIWYSIVIGRNISERRQIQVDLETSLEKYLELAEEAPIGILTCDRQGNIIYVNNRVLDILGSNSMEETRKINLLTFPLLLQHGFSQKLQECMQNNKFEIHEINYESKWGKKVWLKTHIKPIANHNIATGAQIILDDISEKKLMEEELLHLSITDPLTKIYNRRYFMQCLEKEIERVSRTCSRFSVILWDIDHFKHVNDCFGHNTGDLVLKTITAEIAKNIRSIDIFARWGGEEFILLLPETTRDEAVIVAEKLRILISETSIPEVGNVTASFGVTRYHIGDSTDKIAQKADDKMYEAKSAGRNCVRCAQD